MELAIILMIIVGLVLIYAAVKNQDPRTIIKRALGKG